MYNGWTEKNDRTLLVRVSLNNIKDKIISAQSNNSILLKKEDLYAILEYAPNKMIGFILPTDLIVIKNWNVVHRIED